MSEVISTPTWYVYFVDGHREKVEGPGYEAAARLKAQEQRIARGETGHTIQRVSRLRGVPLKEGGDERQKQHIGRPGGEGGEGEGKPTDVPTEGETDGEGEGEGEGEGKPADTPKGGEKPKDGKPKGEGPKDGPPPPPKNGDVVLTRLNEAPLIGKAADDYIVGTAGAAMKDALQKSMGDLKRHVEETVKAQQKPADLLKQVEELVEKKVAEVRPQVIEVRQPDLPPITLEGRPHDLLPRLLAILSSRNHEGYTDPVMLIGPHGCGKTYLARQAAQAMGWQFGSISATAGVDETQFTGRLFPTMQGAEFIGTQFLDFVEAGDAIYLVDEADAMDANVSLVMNQVTANGHLPVPNRRNNPMAERAATFGLILAANTFGDGASRQYVGRNQLDTAFLSRFTVLEMDYDKKLERQIVSKLLPGAAGESLLARWHDMRKKALAASLERNVGTRELVRAADQMRRGIWKTEAEAVNNYLCNWTPSERNKVVG